MEFTDKGLQRVSLNKACQKRRRRKMTTGLTGPRGLRAPRIAPPQAKAPASALNLDLLVARRAGVRVMRGQVTISMWNQFVKETHYIPKGHNAALLKREEIDGDRGFINRADCEAFIKWARQKTGDQTLSLPNSVEYDAIKKSHARRLKGTKSDRVISLNDQYNEFYDLLRSPTSIYETCYYRKDSRGGSVGFRLVGDLRKR